MAPAFAEAFAERVRSLQEEYLASDEAVTATKVLLPIGLLAVYLATIPLFFPLSWESFSGFLVAYFVPPLGKESIIPAAIGAGFPPLAIALYIAALDSIVGLWIVWNWELSLRVPLLGAAVRSARRSGESFLEDHGWLEDVAFYGLVLFVMIPFQGSGAVAASFVGRTIGVAAGSVWAAIVLGAFVGSLTIAYLGQSIIFAFEQALGTGIAVVAGLVLLVAASAFLWWRGRQREPPYERRR